MLYGLYLSAAGLQVQQHRQDTIANNLANAETTGFKRDLANVQSRLNATQEYPTLSAMRSAQTPGSLLNTGAFLTRTTTDFSQATLKTTGNPTDLALEGAGFFALQGDSKAPLLTRDGRFILDSQNRLVSAASGRPVLSTSGQPITLDPKNPIVITTTGDVTQNNTSAGQLALYNPNPETLTKLGDNAYTTTPGTTLTPAADTTCVKQGHLENSGTDPMIELVNMLEAQRTFEANAKMIQYQDQTLSQLNTVGRLA